MSSYSAKMGQRIFLCFILLFLLFRWFDTQSERTAVCFLTRQPSTQAVAFAQALIRDANEDDLHVFIAIDDNSFNDTLLNTSTALRFIRIPNEQSLRAGYQQTIHLISPSIPVSSWDKALFYFTSLHPNYSFVWLIEDDVFIPSTRAFLSLHRLYSSTADLVMNANRLNRLGDMSTWHWWHVSGRFLPPWASSWANVVGLSRRLLEAIDEFVRWRGCIPFIEYYFNTLALHHNLTIVTPTELSTLVYRTGYPFDDIKRNPNNFFHPVKNLTVQNIWRQKLIDETAGSPSKIDFDHLDTLCYDDRSMQSTEKNLTELLVLFDQVKGALPAATRLSLRAKFSFLHGRCEKHNASAAVLQLIQQLADHAYKLPESPVGELVKEKSTLHRGLEEILAKNKAEVLRLLSTNGSNESELVRLRNETSNLIKQLTAEIQREVKEEAEQMEQKTKNMIERSSKDSSSLSAHDVVTDAANKAMLTKNSIRRGEASQISFVLSELLSRGINSSWKEQMGTMVLLMCLLFVMVIALRWKAIIRKSKFVLIVLCILFTFYVVVFAVIG